MSSDYIPRLRSELVRAAERQQSRRWRPVLPLRPLVAAAAVALVVVAVAVAVDRGGSGELEYTVAAGAAEQAAEVMRERLEAGGVADATVSVGSDGRLVIDAPAESRAAVAALTRPGEFAIYDWEASVLGPDGFPAPGDQTVTGGPDAGSAAAISRQQAETRLAASQDGGRVVRARHGTPDRWYALGGGPALTSDDVASAEPIALSIGEPGVGVEFTERGQTLFSALTSMIAERGALVRENQHFAMVFDDEIVAVPFISHRENPDGVDGAEGGLIAGGLTEQTARWMSAMLVSGPLPAELLPASAG